jgi:hypothetical protein
MKQSDLSRIKQVDKPGQKSQLPVKQLLLNTKNIFKADLAIGVSIFRIYVLRFFYLLIIVLFGTNVWIEIFTHKELWMPLSGVAYSFWGAFTILSILGLFHPLKMIPLLLMQFSYKFIWLFIVAYPLWISNQLISSPAEGMTTLFVKSVVVDIIIIPWPYVLKNYILMQKKKE